jgi:hypothetical protein
VNCSVFSVQWPVREVEAFVSSFRQLITSCFSQQQRHVHFPFCRNAYLICRPSRRADTRQGEKKKDKKNEAGL